MTDRRARVLRELDIATGHGLEIGPLHAPLATKDQMDVVYLDRELTEGLRAYYSHHPGPPVEDIVEVDYALLGESGMRSIAVATAEAAPFDWVIASHVIEHVPDVIGWLAEVAEVLVDGGLLSLVVPDRRYTFDARRPPTTVGQMLQAHLDADVRPSVRAVFDHYSEAVTISATEAWGCGPPGPQARIHDMGYVRAMLDRSTKDGSYVDSHVWLFTPPELVEQCRVLAEMELLDFTVHSIIPTDTYDMEFFVTLARIPRGLDEGARRDLFAASSEIDLAPDSAVAPSVGSTLSATEQRLIDLKRKLLLATRKTVRRRTS